MTQQQNKFGQSVGFSVEGWQPCGWPSHTPLDGVTCRLEPTHPTHAADLFDAFVTHGNDKYWTYLPYGPFPDLAAFKNWLDGTTLGKDPQFYTIFDPLTGKAVGLASYLRIQPEIGSIEVGHIHFSTLLQKKPAATEAMFLLMKRAFDEMGYRRYEWKCDALNEPSKMAAMRLGFKPEGVFRQHTMYKGRNRDTAWFSILDSEWPQIKQAFEAWLAPANFNADGEQVKRLIDLR